jgi:hypothetical protein
MTTKKFLITTAVFVCTLTLPVVMLSSAYAVSPTPKPTIKTAISPSPTANITVTDITTPGALDKLRQIELLKEKIATKVAQLREKEKAAAVGKITRIDKTTISISSRTGQKNILTAEDTLYYSFENGTREDSSQKKISEGATITIFGYSETGKDTITAKYIYIEPDQMRISGKVSDVDKTNYTVTVNGHDGNYVVDIETYTKMTVISQGKGKEKAGFSRLSVGDIIQATGTVNAKDPERLSAGRIIIVKLASITPSISPSPSPTIKLTPTPTQKPKTAPSPTPVKKTTPTASQ